MRFLISINIILLFSSCVYKIEQNEVKAINDRDTIKVGEIIRGKFYISHYEAVLPKFYLINKEDTMSLFYDQSQGAAVIEYEASTSFGIKEFDGFVEYYNKEGRFSIKQFKWTFFVEDTLSH